MKRAFTLIEMLAILIVLSILSIILIPVVKNTIKGAKNNTYKAQAKVIESAAESYFIDSNYTVLDDEKKVIYLTDILKSGYIDSKDIVNPINKKKMTGCVLISTYSNQYHYKYLDSLEKCQEYQNIIE